jgi:hypothetical protein
MPFRAWKNAYGSHGQAGKHTTIAMMVVCFCGAPGRGGATRRDEGAVDFAFGVPGYLSGPSGDEAAWPAAIAGKASVILHSVGAGPSRRVISRV